MPRRTIGRVLRDPFDGFLRGNGVFSELASAKASSDTWPDGVLFGQGHTFTPVAVANITAALLAWKQPISGFAVGLSDLELRSAILLFIIYPVLPTRAIDPWGLIEPQSTWATVLLIAALGFVNYRRVLRESPPL